MTSIPAGARCGRHPEATAIALCARCGDFLCDDCAITIDGGSCCAACEPLAGEAFPWERRPEIGVARALVLTTIGTLLRTRATFAPGFRDRSVLPALAFALLVTTPVTWIRAAAELAWPTAERRLAEGAPAGWLFTDEAQIAYAIGAPIYVALSIAVFALGWWLGLAAAGAPRRPFTHVLRAVAYVHGAAAPLSLLALLPGVIEGPVMIVVGLFVIVLQGRALGAITRASGWRMLAAAAVMIGVLAVISCAGAAAVALVTVQ